MKALATVLALGACVGVAQGAQLACGVPENVDGNPTYNRLVCEGMMRLENGDYERAVESLSAAAAEPILEYPNFRVLPSLAKAHVLAGDLPDARAVLAEARHALAILLRLEKCAAPDEREGLLDAQGRRLDTDAAQRAAARMCGEAFTSSYEQTSLDTLENDIVIVQRYYESKALFESAMNE